MNPLSELEELGGYTIEKTHTISCLAFADNLILVADNHDKDQEPLTHREFYIKSLGITMAAHKCSYLSNKYDKGLMVHCRNTPTHRRRGTSPLNGGRRHFELPRRTHYSQV